MEFIKRFWLIALIVFCVIAGPAYALLSSDDLRYCIDHSGQYPTSQSADNQSFSVSISGGPKLWLSCGVGYANANGVAITALATLLLTFVTGGLVWTAYLQIHTARAQLRAYILPTGVTITEGKFNNPPIMDTEGQLYAYVEWKNTGQTPAYKMVSWSEFQVTEPINEDKLIAPKMESAYTRTLGAGATNNRGFWTRKLTPSQIADVSAGVKIIYIYGRFEYTDVFNRPHYTDFRFHYSGVFPIKAGPAALNFGLKGNEST
jgi:hypothetical protein